MTRQSMSFEDRKARINEIAATSYHSSDDVAMDYLGAIEGANIEEQKQLFRLILATHGVQALQHHKCPGENSIPVQEFRTIAERLSDMVASWSSSALHNNASLEETADALWNELTLREGKDRVVALGLLLSSKVVPYAQLPRNFMMLMPKDIYEAAHRRILDRLALLHRVEASESSVLQTAVAMTKILEGIEKPEEQTAFLVHFLRGVLNRSSTCVLAGFVVPRSEMEAPGEGGEE